jgi:hypothetical protein
MTVPGGPSDRARGGHDLTRELRGGIGRCRNRPRVSAASHAEPGDRVSPTSGSGIRTVDVLFAPGEH